MELEEVRSRFPEMKCLLFPKSDYPAGIQLLERLRDLFGKPTLSEEDSFRAASLRQNQLLPSATSNGTAKSAEAFLSEAEAIVTLQFHPSAADKRVLELVNKTRMKGRSEVARYFHNYADVDDWHFVPGLVDRRPALLVRDPRDPSGAPAYFVLLQWAGDKLTTIRDFRHARYVIEGADTDRRDVISRKVLVGHQVLGCLAQSIRI